MTGRTRCSTCGKVCHESRKEAKKVKRLYPQKHLSVYQCGPWWHVGNLPASVIAGDRTRDQIIHKPRSEGDVTERRRADRRQTS